MARPEQPIYQEAEELPDNIMPQDFTKHQTIFPTSQSTRSAGKVLKPLKQSARTPTVLAEKRLELSAIRGHAKNTSSSTQLQEWGVGRLRRSYGRYPVRAQLATPKSSPDPSRFGSFYLEGNPWVHFRPFIKEDQAGTAIL